MFLFKTLTVSYFGLGHRAPCWDCLVGEACSPHGGWEAEMGRVYGSDIPSKDVPSILTYSNRSYLPQILPPPNTALGGDE